MKARWKHVKDLAESMRMQWYNYEQVLMTVLLIFEIIDDVSSVSCLFNEPDAQNVVKLGSVCILLDGNHHWNAVQVQRDGDDCRWTEGPLMNLIRRQAVVANIQAENTRPSNASSTWTDVLKRKTAFVYMMKALVTYVRTFPLQYKASIVNAPLGQILLRTRMFSKFFYARSRATYILIVGFTIFFSKDDQFLPMQENVSKEATTGRDLRFLDSHGLDAALQEEVFLIAKAIYTFLKDPKKTLWIQEVSFKSRKKLVETGLRGLSTQHSSVDLASRQEFMAIKLQEMQGTLRPVEELFTNNKHSINLNLLYKSTFWERDHC